MIGVGSQSLRQRAPRYARSMDSLVEAYSALPSKVNSYTQYKSLERQYESEADPNSLYFLREESARWRTHFDKIPDAEKHKELVKRQVGRRLLEARIKGICLYCWFPEGENCLCDTFILPHQQSVLPQMKGIKGAGGPKGCVYNLEVSFILHAYELFRQTNTGHVAAIVMDSPVVVWGVLGAEHQDRIAVLGMQLGDVGEREVSTAGDKSPVRHESVVDVLLYPEVKGKSVTVDELVSSLKPSDESELTIHLHLSDGTWSQARSVNRHVPKSVPRLMLDVDASYEGLFESLRSRTRETGVSTLEATYMALSQLRHRFMEGAPSSSSAPIQEDILGNGMRLLMKRYVDLVSLFSTKTAYVCNNLSEEEQQAIIERRNRYKSTMQKWEEDDRGQLGVMALGASLPPTSSTNNANAANQASTESLPLPPPVSYFCYVCDAFIHPYSMPQHCSGRKHIDNLKRTGNFSYTPSEASRTMQKPTRSPSETPLASKRPPSN